MRCHHTYTPNHPQAGGTFLTTVISIVVVTVIVGVVMILLEVNRQSKIRTVITEVNRYQAAVMSFKQRFSYLPGDIPKAAAYIPSKVTLKDGNGNLKIEHNNGEGLAAWLHLIASQSINGIELQPATDNKAIIGQTVPQSFLDNNYGWHIDFAEDAGGNHFGFGSLSPQFDLNIGPALSPAQAWEVDKRLDDGNKHTGAVRAFSTNGYFCGNDEYDVKTKSVQCMITIQIRAQ